MWDSVRTAIQLSGGQVHCTTHYTSWVSDSGGNVSEIMILSSQSQINVLFVREDRLYNKKWDAASKIEMTKK